LGVWGRREKKKEGELWNWEEGGRGEEIGMRKAAVGGAEKVGMGEDWEGKEVESGMGAGDNGKENV
jgi:hypothetical protein